MRSKGYIHSKVRRIPGQATHVSKQLPADQNFPKRRSRPATNTRKSAQTCPTVGRTLHNLGGHRRRRIQAEEPKDRRRRGKSVERGKLAPVLPIGTIGGTGTSTDWQPM